MVPVSSRHYVNSASEKERKMSGKRQINWVH